MKVQAFLDFFIAHNTEIIQWLLAAILLIFCGYIAWFLFRKPAKDEISASSTESSEEIKKALHEVLEATKSVAPASAPVAAEAAPTPDSAAPAAAPAQTTVVASPETEAENKKLQQKVEALQKELEAAKSSSEGSDESKAKIEELEAKLSEYEILEDDIADLSLFKDENEKLKKKLAELGASLDEDAAPATTPQADEGESLVEEFQAAVDLTAEAKQAEADEEEELVAPVIEEAESEEKAETTVEEDFVAEFQAAVSVKKDASDEDESSVSVADEEAASEAVIEEKPAPKAALAGPEPEEESGTVSADDLMAEFAQSIGESDAGDDQADSPAAQLNTDKMLEELANLSLDAENSDGTSALEENIDTEKMAAEATKLSSE